MVPYNELQSTILTGHDSAIPRTVIYVKASGYLFYIWASSFIRDPTIRFQFCTASDYPIDILNLMFLFSLCLKFYATLSVKP